MKMKKQYPRWRFHKDLPQVLVQDEKEDAALPEGYGSWADIYAPKSDPVMESEALPEESKQVEQMPVDEPVPQPPRAQRKGRK
jgi:hypothetical protein